MAKDTAWEDQISVLTTVKIQKNHSTYFWEVACASDKRGIILKYAQEDSPQHNALHYLDKEEAILVAKSILQVLGEKE